MKGLPALLVLLLLVPGVAAHAELLRSEPAGDSRLEEPPTFVRVVLTEPVDPAGTSLQVRDQRGFRVDQGDLDLEPGPRPVLTVSLQPDARDGAYTIRWAALSTVDGHTTFGTIGFAVGDFEPPRGSGPSAWDVPSAIGRALAFVGLSLLVGAIGVWALGPLVPDPQWDVLRRQARWAGTWLHLAGVALVFADGAADNDMSLRTFAATDTGGLVFMRLVAGVALVFLAGLWMRRPVAAAGPVLLVGAAAVAALSARLGHGSLEGPVAIVMDMVHLLASAFWVGALAMLLLLLTRAGTLGIPTQDLQKLGQRFGTLATSAVVLIIVTGMVLTFAILGPRLLDPFWLTSTWGLLLAGKWVALAAMLGLALRNRQRFVGDGPASRGAAHPGFPRTVTAELLVGVIVLLLAGFLTSVGTPQAQEPPGTTLSLTGDDFYGSLTIQPRAVVGGSSDLRFYLQSEGGPLVDPDCGRDRCLTLSIEVPGEGANTWFPASEGEGMWVVEDVLWTRDGSHHVTLDVQTAEVYRDVLETDLVVAP